jgi:ATP-dependent exoDNAse (exonuclease V) beta subunit
VDVDAVAWLTASSIGEMLRDNAGRIRREMPVYAAVTAATREPPADPADQVMLRGRIDALVPLEDRLVVIDYKTDAIGAEDVSARAEAYSPQAHAYADAIERMTGKAVQVILVFLRPRVAHVVARGDRP